MAQLKNAYASHEHSLEILNIIYGYDTFMESLKVIADMGCGAGLDTQWWATLTTRDTPPEPYNYKVYAVDRDLAQLDPDITKYYTNVIPIEADFESRIIPVGVDLIWAHDSFQYAHNPLQCLSAWKDTLNTNGMLLMAIPQAVYMHNNRPVTVAETQQFHSYNLLNLIYMLAVSGFDCRDAYFYRKQNTPWLYAAVYATEHKPDPNLSWYHLADMGLLNDSLVNSINRHGYAKLEDLSVMWFDKNFYPITN